jgi:hypothetical protein
MRQDGVEDARFGLVRKKAVAEVAQNAEVEAGVVEREVQRVLPSEVGEHCVGSATVGLIFERLEHEDEGEQNGRGSRAAFDVIQVGEILVVVELEQRVAEEAVGTRFWEVECTPGYNFLRDWLWGLQELP